MKAYHGTAILKFDDNTTGNAASGALVTVRVNSTQALAVIFDVNDVATANPLAANSNGNYSFKSADNIYDIIVSEGTANEVKLEKVEVIETSSLINDLSQAYVFDTVALFKASLIEFPIGKVISLLDRNAGFLIVATVGTPNESNVIENNTTGQSINLETNNTYIPQQWGVDITGATASDVNYTIIRDAADLALEPLTCQGDTIQLATDLELPQYGFFGDCEFTGTGVVSSTNNRKKFHQTGRLRPGNLKITGMQYGKFEHISEPSSLVIDGGDPSRGTFWNDFGPIDFGGGVMEIDTGQGQSINQNTFRQTRAGLHIYGGDGTGIEECDNNIFLGIDTTGADITDVSDGSTGWHLLNNSFLNQRNMIYNWYAEGSGRRAAKGNFNILSAFVDSGGNSPYALERGNYVLFSPDHTTRAQSDYVPISHVNTIKGGSWDILNCNSVGQPVGINTSGGTSASVVADSTEPSGLGFKFGGTNTVSFRAINIPLQNNYHGRYTLCFWLQIVGGIPTAQTFRNGSPQSHSLDVAYEAANNWKLFRISTATRTDGVDDVFQLFFKAPSTEMYISTIWGTPEKAAMIPYPAHPENRIGITNNGAIATVPLALPVGGRMKNYDVGLATGQVVEWAKRADLTAQPLFSMP